MLEEDRTIVDAKDVASCSIICWRHPEKLPDAHSSHTQAVPVHRAVCDYIAGMTDSYFHRMYAEIFGG